MRLSRRRFLKLTSAAAGALAAESALGNLFQGLAASPVEAPGFGRLLSDPTAMLDLPVGFHYRAFSTALLGAPGDQRFGQKLTNGDPVPPMHDGMGAFAGDDGTTLLVRNHEIDIGHEDTVDPGRVRPYDPLAKGGTTTLVVDHERRLLSSRASLSGTARNCAGGTTPWGTWLTAEECTYMPGALDEVHSERTPLVSKPHGYMFEVDPRIETLSDPIPIRAMGRFRHEAVAVDPVTGIVYMTEDQPDGLLYRYRPAEFGKGRRSPRMGDLAQGGVLEALRIQTRPAAITSNWEEEPGFKIGERFRVDWVKIESPDPERDTVRDPVDPKDPGKERHPHAAPTSTRAQGVQLGAARFTRCEGIFHQGGTIWFCATDGGHKKAGQVWRLEISSQLLSLAVEPNDEALLDGPDNLCFAPNGDLIVCEDGEGEDRLIGVSPRGRVYVLARNRLGNSELAGACLSKDRATLFVNSQNPGVTFAIWGPWFKREE